MALSWNGGQLTMRLSWRWSHIFDNLVRKAHCRDVQLAMATATTHTLMVPAW